ncbi:Conjugative transfer protein PilO in PFGI-1-like cluster [Collimonas arenae]|uniref:Conjugative transfer protein PilO in PFGI-1-like cluster n=1 Tax=Collimonas arenae TaxID=279058 RepID=A0A0A1F7H3_9BURK|nr:type 4b pilus protein PilO2 [Collimonas arenae]AIY39639.1 Conjugative transfer protein PilO in PFGI-1-like cluster [Collimonas arenae]
MPILITQIDKRKFICGLFWQSLSRPRELWREAAELGKKIDSDLLLVRREQATVQAGYANTGEGARRGMLSLAALIAKAIAREAGDGDDSQQSLSNWLAAFKLPDGKWAYCAIRDSNFLPNGDFAGTKAEVLERLFGDYALGGWHRVIGDPELAECGFHNFTPKGIEELLPRKKDGQIKVGKWAALRPLQRQISRKQLALAGALAVLMTTVAVAGWRVYQHKAQERERERALEAVRQQMLGQAGPSQAPHPWPGKPLPKAFARACVAKLDTMSPGGWLLEEYVCEAGRSRTSWSRAGSTTGYLLAQVPAATLDASGDKASFNAPLSMPSGGNETLLATEQLLRPLQTRFQLLGLALKVALVPVPKPLPGAEDQKVPLPDWQTYSLAVNAGGVPPAEIAAILAQPGIRLDKLSYRGGAWTFEGVMYAK